MKLRTYLSDLFGGIREALNSMSQVAAVIHSLDQKAGKRGARGKHFMKNPFKGIACSNGSAYGPQFFRHVEGARDSRRTFNGRRRDAILCSILMAEPYIKVSFRDTQSHPVMFNK